MRTVLTLFLSAALLSAQCIDYWYSPEQAKADQLRQQQEHRSRQTKQVRMDGHLVPYTEWIQSSSVLVQKPVSLYRDYRFVGRVCGGEAR